MAKSSRSGTYKLNLRISGWSSQRPLKGFPRHLSQQVGGFVISRGRSPSWCRSRTPRCPSAPIQWDKDDLDALGLSRLMCLRWACSPHQKALKMTVLKCTRSRPKIRRLYAMIRRPTRVGVFRRIARADEHAAAPAAAKLLRPGGRGGDRAPRPIQGGMVHPYLKRRRDPSLVAVPGAAVREVICRTLGVPSFQEQVDAAAVVAAGFTPGEATALRRSMAAWKRHGGLEPFEERSRPACAWRGFAESRGDYRQIRVSASTALPSRTRRARAAGLRVLVDQVPLPGAVLRRAAQQPADGLSMPCQLVRTRGGTAWKCCRRMPPERLDLHARSARLAARIAHGRRAWRGGRKRIALQGPISRWTTSRSAPTESQGARLPSAGGALASLAAIAAWRAGGGRRRAPAAAGGCGCG